MGSHAEDPTLQQQRRSRPQLRLLQLFVFISSAAVLLTIERWHFHQLPSTNPLPALRALIVAETLILVLLQAAVLTVAGYCLVWWRRGALILAQPGHWLIVAMATVFLASYGDRLISSWQYEMASLDWAILKVTKVLLHVVHVFFIFGPWILCVYIGLTKCNDRRWKWVFIIYAAAGAAQLVIALLIAWLFVVSETTTFYYVRAAGFWIGQLVLLAYAVTLDRQLRISRDSIHWAGAGLYAARNAIPLVTMPGWWFLA